MLYRKTFAQIDLSAIKKNIRRLKGYLPASSEVMAVVKANAYGHGIIPVAHAALDAGAKYLAVALPEEAIPLREAGISVPILVMANANKDQAELSVELDLWQCAFKQESIHALNRIAKKLNKKAMIHLKIDTGMSRVGVRSEDDLQQLINTLKGCENIILDGVFTHFACADEKDQTYTVYQNKLFQERLDLIRNAGFSPRVHAGNSAICTLGNELAYDFVRCGISMYGYPPAGFLRESNLQLEPAMQVMAEISQIKTVPAGTLVGYGSTYETTRETKIATVQIGYGDGYNRLLSNCGKMIAGGEFAPVIGRVCMDQTMIDITKIDSIREGDCVTVMGSEDSSEFWADEIADICNTISYEIVLGYSDRVPRVYT